MGFFKSQNNYESPLGILSLKFKIGEGAFGVVYRGHFLRNNIECAIKVLNLNNETSIKDIINEIELHDSLKHDNLIGLMGKFKINNSFYLAMEYCVCDVE
ncbi:MAG: Mitogen-activated protein kinase kinase kinase kinase 1, partial [Paramarteilia canceri]